MRRLFLALALAGCFAINDQVRVGISNHTQQTHDFEVHVWWLAQGEEPEAWGNASGSIEAGGSRPLLSFQRPCDDRLVGTVVYVGALANGTAVDWRQEWDADGCVEQHVSFVLEDGRVRFTAFHT